MMRKLLVTLLLLCGVSYANEVRVPFIVQDDLDTPTTNYLDVQAAGTTVKPDLTLDNLTASRLLSADGSKVVVSVADLTSWVAGTTNRVSVADDGDGSLTLSTPQDTHTAATPTFSKLTLSSTATDGLTVGAGGGAYVRWHTGGSRIYDVAGNLTIESDTAQINIGDTIAVSGNIDGTGTLEIDGATGLDGNVDLGNAVADTTTNYGEGNGFRHYIDWADDTTVSATSATVYVYNGGFQQSATVGFRMMRAGSITGFSANYNATAVNCCGVFDININGTTAFSVAATASTGVKNVGLTVARNADTFSAGDIISVALDNGVGTYTYNNATYELEIYYD